MGVTNVYSKNGYFAVAQTGNTLGMAGNASQPTYYVNAWVTLDSNLNNGVGVPSNTGTYTYGGTTNSYLQNGSFAYLNPSTALVPSGSTVDYAILTWVGTINSPSSLALFNVATIPFTDPTGAVNILTPNLTLNNQGAGAYNIISRSADVTTIVANAGYGKYTVQRVPGDTLVAGQALLAGAGWTLVVVYKHPNLPYRNVSINVGTLAYNTNQTISGFYTPSSGTTVARVFGSWTQGNSDYGVESFLFNGVALSGPNNPVGNFFCSQINDDFGLAQNTFGSFANQSCTTGQRPVGQRTCYDITNVSGNGILANKQRSTTIQSFSSGLEVTNTHVIGIQIENNAPVITPTKYVDLTTADGGDTLNYTIVFKNTGSETASNVVFLDTIPTDTTFNSASLIINGNPSALNPQNGVTLSDLGINAVSTVQFSVTVNTLSQPTTIPNSAQLTYRFISDPSLPSVFATITSNTVNTNINPPNIILNKTVDKLYAKKGDTIFYNLIIKNNSLNTLLSLTLVDTIPVGTNFIQNTLTIDGVANAGTPNPPGLSLQSLAGNTVRTVSFQVQVVTIPTTNAIVNIATVSDDLNTIINSNYVYTTINELILDSSKAVNKNYATIGDILTYTIAITNSGNVTADSIIFLDTIPNGTSLVGSSFKQDGISVSGSPNSPGATLPNSIKAGGVTTVTFQVYVTTTPNPNPIPNSAMTTATFIIDATTLPNRIGTDYVNSNIVSTKINYASLGGIKKYVDKNFANCGDIINYTIIIPNTGNVTAKNIFIIDTVPSGTILVPNSVFVNGTQQIGVYPDIGVTIPDIGPGQTSTLTFNVKVQCQ